MNSILFEGLDTWKPESSVMEELDILMVFCVLGGLDICCVGGVFVHNMK